MEESLPYHPRDYLNVGPLWKNPYRPKDKCVFINYSEDVKNLQTVKNGTRMIKTYHKL